MKKILIQFGVFFLVIACIFVFTGNSDGWTEPPEEEATGDILLSGQMYSGKVVVNIALHPDGTLEHEGNGEKTSGTWEKAEDAIVAHIVVKDNPYDMKVLDNGDSYTAEYPPVAGLTLTGKKPVKDIILSGEKFSGKVVVKITLHGDGTGEHEGNGEKTSATWEAGTGDVAMVVHFNVKDTDYDMNVMDNGVNYVADYPLVGDMQLTGAKNGAAPAPAEEAPKAEEAAPQPAAAEAAEESDAGNVLSLSYVADVNPQLTGTFSSPYAVWSAALGTSGNYAPTESTDVILTWDSTGKSKAMEFFANGTYEFRFTTMSIAEHGTWTWKDSVLTVTTEGGNTFTAEAPAAAEAAPKAEEAAPQPAAAAEESDAGNALSLSYVADVNPQLTGTFSSPYDTWSAALGTSGSYTPTESTDVILTWDSTGKSKAMEFFANGTYEFRFTTMSVAEHGTWTWKDSVLTVTTEGGNTFTAEQAK